MISKFITYGQYWNKIFIEYEAKLILNRYKDINIHNWTQLIGYKLYHCQNKKLNGLILLGSKFLIQIKINIGNFFFLLFIYFFIKL